MKIQTAEKNNFDDTLPAYINLFAMHDNTNKNVGSSELWLQVDPIH